MSTGAVGSASCVTALGGRRFVARTITRTPDRALCEAYTESTGRAEDSLDSRKRAGKTVGRGWANTTICCRGLVGLVCSGVGMRGMRERIRNLGGTFKVCPKCKDSAFAWRYCCQNALLAFAESGRRLLGS